MRSSWAGVFLMLFLVGGGMVIAMNNIIFVTQNGFNIALASLVSMIAFLFLVYEDKIFTFLLKLIGRSSGGTET